MVKKVLYFNEFGGKIYDIYSTDLFLTTYGLIFLTSKKMQCYHSFYGRMIYQLMAVQL